MKDNSCQFCNKYCDKLELYDDENLSGRFYWICRECEKIEISGNIKANLILIFIILIFIFISLVYSKIINLDT